MAALNDGFFYRCDVWCTSQEQASINRYFYKIVPGSITGGVTEQDAADYWDTILGELYKGVLSEQAKYYGVGFKRVVGPTVPDPYLPSYAHAHRGWGSTTGDQLPRQTCGLISRKVSSHGRHGKGRVYIPFPGEFDSDELAHPTEAYLGALQSLADAAFQVGVGVAFGPGGLTWVPALSNIIDSTTTPATWADPWYSPVDIYHIRRLWATQRRRSDFGRPNVPPF
jgi:hypothetical protein